MGYKGRDVEVVSISGGQYIVTACDSSGAIGLKEFDVVKVPPSITGRYAARVALLEVMAVGAVPRVLTAAICNEPSPTGEGILHGVQEELKSLGLMDLQIAISTEKNMPTSQTSVGITVVGTCEKEKLRIGTSISGDRVYCIGMPLVGNEVAAAEDFQIVKGEHLIKLLNKTEIHDIIPVGSRGVMGEMESLCSTLQLGFILEGGEEIDLRKSGGPSTCAIFTSSSDIVPSDFKDVSLIRLGKLV